MKMSGIAARRSFGPAVEGISHLAALPAVSPGTLVKLLAHAARAPVAGIVEISGEDCVVAAVHDGCQTGLRAGQRIRHQNRPCEAVVRSGEVICLRDVSAEVDRFPLMVQAGLRGFLGVPLADRDGDPIGMLWVADREVREFDGAVRFLLESIAPKLAEELSRVARGQLDASLYEQVLEYTRESVVLTDLEGVIRYVNPALLISQERRAEEVMGKSMGVFGEGVFSEELLREILERSLSGGFEGRVPNRTGTGREIVVDLRTSLIRDPEGRPILLAGFSHDVTDQISAEHELHQATQQFQALFDATDDAILLVDRELRAAAANRRFGEFFGLDPTSSLGIDDEELRRTAHRSFADPEAFERRVSELYATPDAKAVDEVELIWPCERTLLRTHTCVRDREGRELGRLWIFRDVTEQRRMELELRESKRQLEEKAALLSEQDRHKSRFLATTSHELRTPLNSLLGFIKLILEGVCTSRDEERSMLSHAFNTGKHLVDLLEDILDLAKVESGTVTLQTRSVDTRRLLDEVVPSIAVQARSKGLDFASLVPEQGLPGAMADYRRLKQVLINLLGNAVKYTSSGRVEFAASAVPGSAVVRFEVRDTGVGMSESTLRAVRSGQVGRGSQGLGGLGLAIARRFVELMGGTLSIRSPGVGKGTEVIVELPASRGGPSDDSPSSLVTGPAPLTKHETSGMSVLIVEDDLASSLMVRVSLERLGGFRVHESDDVKRILDLSSSGEVDAVLMDVSLDNCYHDGRPVDGLQITRLIKGNPGSAHLPVILMTAHAMVGDRERLMAESGADEYECKPILDMSRLMMKIAALIRRSQTRET